MPWDCEVLMLRDLLHLVADQGVVQVEELAQRLHASPGLVRAMLDTLERQGRLKRSAPTCGVAEACAGCPLSGFCRAQGMANPILWEWQDERPAEALSD